MSESGDRNIDGWRKRLRAPVWPQEGAFCKIRAAESEHVDISRFQETCLLGLECLAAIKGTLQEPRRESGAVAGPELYFRGRSAQLFRSLSDCLSVLVAGCGPAGTLMVAECGGGTLGHWTIPFTLDR